MIRRPYRHFLLAAFAEMVMPARGGACKAPVIQPDRTWVADDTTWKASAGSKAQTTFFLATVSKRMTRASGWSTVALLFLLQTAPVSAASLEGEAAYLERIMPPAGAVLVVSLEDSARADAPSTELAASRMRLAGEPPYRWRLDYDERLVISTSRPVLRARIETPEGLWMSTDTVMPASTPTPVLQLRRVSSPPQRCGDAVTQTALNECAYEEFLEASAAKSLQLKRIESALKPARRSSWRRQQKAWLTFRTEACEFESGALGNGSARPMVQWQCAARMTRQRTADLSRLGACREGDIACSMPELRKSP